jgi:uncharacterized membrane protein
MLKIKRTIEIDAPVNQVWRTLAEFDDVSTWSHAVTKAHCSSPNDQGVGAERVCEVAGLGTLVEQVVYWKEGETLAYEISGISSIVTSAECSWHLERKHRDPTTLTITMILETRFGAIGALTEKLVLGPKLSTILDEVIVQFRHYVETGRPLSGDVLGLTQPATA